MTHIKKNTDISGFEVKRLKTVDKNVSLSETKTFGDLVIHRHERKQKTLSRRQRRINKLVKEVEK